MAKDLRRDSPLKVLIVDDEQLVRKGLRMTVDWGRHGMAVVGDAPNGILGWEKVVNHEPDIVITDIVMPEMDGIELAHKIRHRYPYVKVLFLSCHRDFAYAQQGIQLGVSDYIVKTSMGDEEMERCLDKIRRECELHLQNQSSMAASEDEMQIVMEWLRVQDITADERLVAKLNGDWSWMTRGGCIFHLYDNGSANNSSFSMSDDKRKEYRNEVPSPIGPEPEPKAFLKIGEAFASGSPGRAFLPCPDGTALLACHWAERDTAEHELLHLKSSRNPGLGWRLEGPVEGRVRWIESVLRLLRLRAIERETRLVSRQHKEDILSAIDYINHHLHLDPRVGEIADRIGISRSYFSTVFKEATGSSLIDFLSQKKLERAQNLLAMTDYRMEEVAEKIGIGDVKYFAKWFKKSVGFAPGQYRQQTKRHQNPMK